MHFDDIGSGADDVNLVADSGRRLLAIISFSRRKCRPTYRGSATTWHLITRDRATDSLNSN